jgi:CDP-glycerol glycerophosphotransferase
LARAGISLNGRQLVVYAPTWRGPDFSSPENNSDQIIATTRRLQQLLGSDRFVVVLKAHQALHDRVARSQAGRSLLVPNDIPTNVILGITDALVTDYSSIFFDFLPLPGPIVFFAEDRSDYSRIRGTYFAADDLPGPVCTELEAVADAIVGRQPLPAEIALRREEWRSRFAENSDGDASRRVADVVFRGLPGSRTPVSLSPTTRTSILLHIGSLRSNGITSAALNLLGALDSPDVDVSVVFARPGRVGQAAQNQRRIPAHVRQFICATHTESRVGRIGRRLSFVFAQHPRRAARIARSRRWSATWNWCFGTVSFDHIIDFDGYGPFWANLLLSGPSATHSIWLHNDMAAEQHRIVRGRQRIRRSLGAVFALYPEFDHLVSVSPALADVNRRELANRYGIDPAAFVAARNIIDGERVIEAATEGVGAASADPDTAPEWWRELTNPERQTKWFVTVGRLSTEKNQARLIRSFAQVHRERAETRLLIIGDGPVGGDLIALAGRLGLAGSVIFTGHLPNPFPALSSADCFVLSSDHEGQPMVIMEAAILGLPIVAVNFATVRDALPDSSIHVVEPHDDALARGMLHYLDGFNTPVGFDFVAYNAAALAEFRSAIRPGIRHP